MSFFKNLLVNQTEKLSYQLFRALFVGVAASLVDFAILYIATERFQIYYLASALLGFVGGLITNYLLSTYWIFSKRSLKKKWMEFAVFGIIGTIGLGLTELLLWFFTEIVLIHYLFSKVLATVIVFAWNFFSRKYLLFK